MNANNKEYGE